ncbi:MAG: hypothetical protein U0183_30040 [Polyangiaceae bacterium]
MRLSRPSPEALVAIAGGAFVAFAVGCEPSIDVPPSALPRPSPSARGPGGQERKDADAGARTKPALDGYVHVARRERVAIGLAEAREIDPHDANEVVERLADRFEACAQKLETEGALTPGAGRLVVLLDERGHVTATDAKLSPGSDVAGAALLCLLAPARALAYPPGKGSRRGFAVEAVWEKVR